MDSYEQLPPNKPNFKLILVLFAVSIVVILVLAIFFLKRGAKHMEPNGRTSPASSRLSVPTLAPNSERTASL